jgi:hypothetical protein
VIVVVVVVAAPVVVAAVVVVVAVVVAVSSFLVGGRRGVVVVRGRRLVVTDEGNLRDVHLALPSGEAILGNGGGAAASRPSVVLEVSQGGRGGGGILIVMIVRTNGAANRGGGHQKGPREGRGFEPQSPPHGFGGQLGFCDVVVVNADEPVLCVPPRSRECVDGLWGGMRCYLSGAAFKGRDECGRLDSVKVGTGE